MKSLFARRFLIAASLSLLVVVSLIWLKNKKLSSILRHLPIPEPLVETVVLQQRSWPLIIDEVGMIKASDEVNVSSLVMGNLDQILVKPGQFVHQGQTLFILEHAAHQASYEQALSSLNLAQLKFERYKKLWDAQVISQEQFDESHDILKQAQAIETQAKANLDHHFIKASIDGFIDYFTLSPGSLVRTDMVLTKLYAPQPYNIEFSVSHQYASWISRGNHIKTHHQDSAHVAEILCCSVGITPAYPRLLALAALKETTSLIPGQTVPILIEVDTESLHFVVPQLAIDYTSLGSVVWIVNDGQKVKPLMVEVYRFKDGKAAIKSDQLKPGQRIVSIGQQKLRDNMKVRFHESIT
ncbi:efflux RND transporter periplasmic adaptor subunit [bacterium]|nr:efflux RND transporter periplasmic adaptor subunit [bacterium]